MSANGLTKLLDNIHNNTPINLPRFIKLIEQLDLNHRFNVTDISATKVKGDRYLVTHIQAELVRELKRYTSQSGHDRISAARQNLSHQHKVMGSYLLVIRAIEGPLPNSASFQNTSTQNTSSKKTSLQNTSTKNPSHPIVVLIDDEGDFYYPPALIAAIQTDFITGDNSLKQSVLPVTKNTPTAAAPEALLIENRQLFLHGERTVKFLHDRCEFDSANYDIIFAAGNEISNRLHQKFLSQYRKLYFCFDIDLGGVTIAKNLIEQLPDTPYQFLMPTDIHDRIAQVSRRVAAETVAKVRSLSMGHDGLMPVCHVISQNFKTIEQESFLHE
ncbi:hypothetical protein [Psychrobacter pygoscelis]|uniref:hypothetical protein n=1 Tax=Psychrobacter pygoscelis TaxID=2488563 RepID=UPI001039EAAF|nr:hypothetical protein [Psychrobacter pygoscelis]